MNKFYRRIPPLLKSQTRSDGTAGSLMETTIATLIDPVTFTVQYELIDHPTSIDSVWYCVGQYETTTRDADVVLPRDADVVLPLDNVLAIFLTEII